MWMAKRNNPLAKTDLQELLHSKTIIAQAPTFLKEEVEKYLPILAEEKNIELTFMQGEWDKYTSLIIFYDITIEEYEKENVRDPKDLPYIKLQKATGAIIHSKDKDIQAMGGTVITHSVITNLRDYSRNSAIEYTLKIGGVFAGHISENLIDMLMLLLKKVFSSIKGLPEWARWMALGMLILALLNKNSRDKLTLLSTNILIGSVTLINDIYEEIEPMIIAHEKAKLKASENLKIIQNDINENK